MKQVRIGAGIFILLILGGLLLNIQNITPAPHMDDLNSGSMLDSLFAIVLVSLVLFIAIGLGSIATRPFKQDTWSSLERLVIHLPVGLAVIGYAVFFLGLMGWIKPLHLLILLTVAGILSFTSSVSILVKIFNTLLGCKKTWSDFSIPKKVLFSAGLLALLLLLLQAFTPPWDYDGLAYHIQGPRLFLQAGRILPLPENWFTFYPSTWEMVYLLGMGLGSDIFARLIHFATLILFLLATYAFGKRFISATGGWVAGASLLGIPILLLWGNAAYTDIAWGLFQFLAIALLLEWNSDRKPRMLILAGMIQGLALGSKYLALSGVGVLMVVVLWQSAWDGKKLAGLKQPVLNGLFFGLAALIIGLPWYLKNYLWTGNPVFPLYLPQHVIDPIQFQTWMDYVNSFGTGKRWYDYLLLPINLYLQHEKFGTFMGSMEIASPIFLAAVAYPLIRKGLGSRLTRTLDLLGIITLLFFLSWAVGSQQTRFLLPVFPGLSILSSVVLLALARGQKSKRLGRVFLTGLVGGMVVVTLIFMGIYIGLLSPQNVILGMETKSGFLRRVLGDYPALEYINNNLPESARVMSLWDGRGYYCESKCLPDVDQSRWVTMVEQSDDIHILSNRFQEEGISHLFFSKEDVAYFLIKHDQNGIHKKGLQILTTEFVPKCSDVIYEDDLTIILELSLDKVECRNSNYDE
ncbi:MAG: hypothetical protein C0391_08375 [Anaerolinea sp.]|nr:hypothetical protein [Anaerolinea sp.]